MTMDKMSPQKAYSKISIVECKTQIMLKFNKKEKIKLQVKNQVANKRLKSKIKNNKKIKIKKIKIT